MFGLHLHRTMVQYSEPFLLVRLVTSRHERNFGSLVAHKSLILELSVEME